MSSFSISTQNHRLFRRAIIAFAFVLAFQAAWILFAEILRPSLPGFPVNAQAAEAAAAERNDATLAASFGAIRGDLWAECAITYLNLLWSEGRQSASGKELQTIEQGRGIADAALALAPHDSRIWLVLAGLDLRLDQASKKAAAGALRMSYYTGANETEIIPLRLLLAVRSEALADKDFQQLVHHDILVIVTREPQLKAAILSAYPQALPIGKKFLEDVLKDLDPSLLARFRLRG